MAPRETENNAYAKFWGDKQRALWYVMVFLEWSIPNADYFMQHCQHCYTVSTYTCLQHIFFWLLNQIISHAFKQTLQNIKLFEMMRH